MKKFNSDGKINFVDDNNCFVGYDMDNSCCEKFDWVLSDTLFTFDTLNSIEQLDRSCLVVSIDSEKLLEPYCFNKIYTNFCIDDCDAGMIYVFTLVADNKKDLYLYFYNCQNGYYSHGLEMIDGDKKILEEYL